MRVLQVTPFDTTPAQTGSEQRAHGLLSAFPDCGDEVRRYSQLLRKSSIKNGDLRKKVTVIPEYTEFRSRNPVYELVRAATSYLLNVNSMTYIGDALEAFPTAELEDHLQWADIIHVRDMWQVPAIAAMTETPVVFSNHRLVDHQHTGYQTDGSVLMQLLGLNPREMREIEEAAVRAADAILCHSEHEKDGLEDTYDPSVPIFIAPAAIESDRLQTDDDVATTPQDHPDDTEYVGVFLGAGTHKHNIDSAEACVEFSNEMNERGYDTHVYIVGNVGDAIDHSSVGKDVTVTGYVDDIDGYMSMADFALNPTLGKGVNVKNLDYFARRIPVITTPEGTSGFNFGEKTAIVSTRENMVADFTQLLEDDEPVERFGERGYEYVANNHTWDSVSRSLRATYEDWLGHQ